ncbi:MAG TPA: DoxX family protein [Gemmatimonadales bacterium]|nr:DoxX family protein [Gemmatimonadales bacterium]
MTSPRAWYGSHSDKLYAVMRIMVAFLYLSHGLQKHFAVFGGPMARGAGSGLFQAAGIIEIVCGLAILIGFRASWAAFIASGEMAVAYFLMHFPHSFFPIENHGEIVVAFCFVFLYISSRGAGPWSVDGAGSKQ